MRRALAAGYEAVTNEGFAESAKVPKQTTYRLWPSMAAVLGQALVEWALPDADVVIPMTDDLGADLCARLSAMSDGLARSEGVAPARALVEVNAADLELGFVLRSTGGSRQRPCEQAGGMTGHRAAQP